jgi:arylsulfatase B
MLEAMDTELGRLLDNVDLATTTVIFMGDNGTPTNQVRAPYQGAEGKGTVYQGGVHVPLIIAGQGVTARGYNQQLVSCVDLFPTMIELAGVDLATVAPSVDKDGVTLIPYLEGRSHPTPRRYVYSEEFTASFSTAWERTIRNDDFVLIRRASGTVREFYNLALDPRQDTNLMSRTRTALEQANLDELEQAMTDLLNTR